MTDLTKAIIKKNIMELEDAIHEVYLGGGDMTSEGNAEIDRLEEAILDFEAMLKEVE